MTAAPPRLYVDAALHEGASVTPSDAQTHYLLHVMRLRAGDAVRLFNGRDGEWAANVVGEGKKTLRLHVTEQTAPLMPVPDLWLLFAPIKAGRIEFLVEKATELGARTLQPVRTARTIVNRVNEARLLAHAIEAAEQSGRTDVPSLLPYLPLHTVLEGWDSSRILVYGDESGAGSSAADVFSELKTPLTLLTGPEGGFTPQEFEHLRSLPFTRPVSLGSRILRADTAALALLTCAQLYCGDWNGDNP